jgi:hypothetical protein
MPRKWLQTAIESDYLPKIQALKNTPSGRRKADALNLHIRQQWFDRGFTTLPQQQSLMDDTHRNIKNVLGERHWILEHIRFTTEEYTDINSLLLTSLAPISTINRSLPSTPHQHPTPWTLAKHYWQPPGPRFTIPPTSFQPILLATLRTSFSFWRAAYRTAFGWIRYVLSMAQRAIAVTSAPATLSVLAFAKKTRSI